jgi:thiol-disulfide isomerase/thioredoxin
LAAGLVLVAVVVILAAKMATNSPTAGLRVVEGGSATMVPAPLTGASGSAVDEPTPVAAPAVIAAKSDPMPTEPAAQVEWILRNNQPAMVLFHSTNCKPCIAMTALVEQIRGDYEDRIVFIDVVTNEVANAALVRQAGIQAIPTTIFVTSSGEGRGHLGLMKEEDLRAELTKLLPAESGG